MINAFQPQGNTVALSVTTSSHNAVNVPGLNNNASMQYEITNTGPNPAFVVAGPNSGVAAAVIPTDGTPANGWVIMNGQRKVITTYANAWFTAICASTQSATLYITPGDGIA